MNEIKLTDRLRQEMREYDDLLLKNTGGNLSLVDRYKQIEILQEDIMLNNKIRSYCVFDLLLREYRHEMTTGSKGIVVDPFQT